MLLLLSVLSPAAAEDAWLLADVELLRWSDAVNVSTKLEQGAQVEVLVRDAKLARVRQGADFGWVQLSLLSATEVASVPDLPLSLDALPPGLTFPGLPGAQ